MRADIIEVVTNTATYQVENPKIRDGLSATVTALDASGVLLHSDRVNLDKAKQRDSFAKVAEIPADDLLTVRIQVVEILSGAPTEAEPEPIDPETEAAGIALLDSPDILSRVGQTIRALGYAGDVLVPLIIYLALVSRLLERPLNLVISGPSAAGKSFATHLVSRLFPHDAIYALSGMSERVLAYTDADLRHRVLIIGESTALHQDGLGASLLRAVAWEGKVAYETVEKTANGLQPRRIEKPGPTGFITTTTRNVERELETRVLTLTISDTEDVTRVILRATAGLSNGRVPEEPDLAIWHAAQLWLSEHGERTVTIPYAEQLAELVPADQVRMRRDFIQLVTLIKAHAVLYQRQRERDEYGRIVATEADYEAVYSLVAPVFQAIAADGVTPQVRETVAGVAELTSNPDETVTVKQVAAALGLDTSAAWRRVRQAVRGGWIVNEETRRGQPAKLRVGDLMPEDKPALPTPEKLLSYPSCKRANVQTEPEKPHADGQNPIAEPIAREKTVQTDAQTQFYDSDGQNAERLHDCTIAQEVKEQKNTCLNCGREPEPGYKLGKHGECLDCIMERVR